MKRMAKCYTPFNFKIKLYFKKAFVIRYNRKRFYGGPYEKICKLYYINFRSTTSILF